MVKKRKQTQTDGDAMQALHEVATHNSPPEYKIR